MTNTRPFVLGHSSFVIAASRFKSDGYIIRRSLECVDWGSFDRPGVAFQLWSRWHTVEQQEALNVLSGDLCCRYGCSQRRTPALAWRPAAACPRGMGGRDADLARDFRRERPRPVCRAP